MVGSFIYLSDHFQLLIASLLISVNAYSYVDLFGRRV